MNYGKERYLTSTKHGVWYYQRWNPTHFQIANRKTRTVFRVSLRTKDKQKAKAISRIISVKLDELALKFFNKPEEFSIAMELLFKDATSRLNNPSLTMYEEDFLSTLTTSDARALDKAYAFRESLSLSQKQNKKSKIPDSKNPTLKALFEQWKINEKVNMVQSSYENTYLPTIHFFIRLLEDQKGGELRIAELDADHIRYYQSTYKQIPSRTVVKNFTIDELLLLNGKTKSPKTIRDNFRNLGTFLNWVYHQGHPIKPNLHAVLTKGSGVRISKKETIQRVPLDKTDLKKLFQSEKYLESGKFFSSAMYWVPLIAIFTGARMSEILQLEKNDIRKIDHIWTIRFDDIDPDSTDESKHVKGSGSYRIVPIHKTLLELDFIKYKNTTTNRLFASETRNSKGKFDSFQKRFRTYRKQVNVMRRSNMEYRDFHSIRHTVITKLSDLRMKGKENQFFETWVIDAIVGHKSNDRSVGEKTYNHSNQIATKNKVLNRLNYPNINFKEIVHWKKCAFKNK